MYRYIIRLHVWEKTNVSRGEVFVCGFASVTGKRGIYVFSGTVPELHGSVRRFKTTPVLASCTADRLAYDHETATATLHVWKLRKVT
jgi:hypothetical protein